MNLIIRSRSFNSMLWQHAKRAQYKIKEMLTVMHGTGSTFRGSCKLPQEHAWTLAEPHVAASCDDSNGRTMANSSLCIDDDEVSVTTYLQHQWCVPSMPDRKKRKTK
jgi:hypothetical protein